MTTILHSFKNATVLIFLCVCSLNSNSQAMAEWQLAKPTYSMVDPDGAGPATGSVTFTMQLRSISGNITNVTATSTGYAYQSTSTMLPSSVTCVSNSPSNIVISPEFVSAGFSYAGVNQCSILSTPISTGGQSFDRRAVGLLETITGSVTLTPTFKDVFTVTLWTLGTITPEGGYVIINSGFGGTPGPFGSYAVSGGGGEDYITNSLTYTTPLALGTTVLPVLFTKFNAQCNGSGTLISWSTAQEGNSSKFEIERSADSRTWSSVATVAAAGNSLSEKNYQQLDLIGGKAFYRIKQTDKDGSFIYTNIESVNCITKNISSVIYPVPAKDVLNVVIRADRAIRTQLLVFDIAGKLMKKLDAQVVNGNNTFRINLNGLVAGDYILKSSDASIELNKVFTISR